MGKHLNKLKLHGIIKKKVLWQLRIIIEFNNNKNTKNNKDNNKNNNKLIILMKKNYNININDKFILENLNKNHKNHNYSKINKIKRILFKSIMITSSSTFGQL
jgi:hypothetical protein